jgi:aminoglycoside phosphotransferase family enzyme/predicted kinase
MPPDVVRQPARVVETHLSVLFFFGEHVVKVRRPVAYGFVDLSSLDRRRVDCEREVLLNRRLAADVYLGTATLEMAGSPVEHAVVMRRLPEERNLAMLVADGAPIDAELRAVAAALASFHRDAQRSPGIDASATADALWQRWQATEEDLGPFVGSIVERDAYRELTGLAWRYLAGRGPLLERRIAEGNVCDGHGDLQAADIFCMEDGPRILDCLEFDDQLRHGDVLADVAFLAEDLERLGAPHLATLVLDEYERRTSRPQPASLVHFYTAQRAHVRLLVDCLRLEAGLYVAPDEPARVLALALAHLRAAQPRLVLVGGPPGSGKSTLASWLGRRLGAAVLSTDRERMSRDAHDEPAARGSSDNRYTTAARTTVYERLLDRAGELLRTGRSVVFDATWGSASLRRRAAALARAASADLVQLRCECPAAERAARVAARHGDAGHGSQATPEVAAALAAAEDPWPGASTVDTSGPVTRSREAALRALGAGDGPAGAAASRQPGGLQPPATGTTR